MFHGLFILAQAASLLTLGSSRAIEISGKAKASSSASLYILGFQCHLGLSLQHKTSSPAWRSSWIRIWRLKHHDTGLRMAFFASPETIVLRVREIVMLKTITFTIVKHIKTLKWATSYYGPCRIFLDSAAARAKTVSVLCCLSELLPNCSSSMG
jgi:hypothetical protein